MLRLRRAPDFWGHSIVGEVEKYTGPAVTVDLFCGTETRHLSDDETGRGVYNSAPHG